MKLGMEVVLGTGHIVLDGTQLPLPRRGTVAPIFGPCLLWPNGLMYQDATWYGVGLGPDAIVLLDVGPSSPKRGTDPHFLARVYCGQTAVWIKMPFGTKVGPSPGHIVLNGVRTQLPLQKVANPQFS